MHHSCDWIRWMTKTKGYKETNDSVSSGSESRQRPRHHTGRISQEDHPGWVKSSSSNILTKNMKDPSAVSWLMTVGLFRFHRLWEVVLKSWFPPGRSQIFAAAMLPPHL